MNKTGKYVSLAIFFFITAYLSYFGRTTYLTGLVALFLLLCIAAILLVVGVIQLIAQKKPNLVFYSIITVCIMFVSSSAGKAAEDRKVSALKNNAMKAVKILDSYALENGSYPKDIVAMADRLAKAGINITGISYEFINEKNFTLHLQTYCGYYFTKSDNAWALHGCK